VIIMSNPQAKFSELSKLKYKDQAVWFLNGFWGDGVNADVANKVWEYVRKFVELDLLGPERKGEAGNEWDQFWSAKFLEDMDTALPSLQRKEALRTIDQDSNGKMSLIEYLVWKYKKGVKETVDAPQGDNVEAIKKAQQALDRVAAQMAECEKKLDLQKKAKEANDQAVAELRKQEEDYKTKCQTLEAKSKDQNATVVQRNKAANELAQLKGEDPLPLRKAKITQEAAGRALERAIKELEQAYVALEAKMAEAQEELEKVRSKPGGGKGAIWFMQRELFEVDNRLPKAKQKFDHSKAFNFSP